MSLKRKLVTLTIAEKVNIMSEVTNSDKPKNEIAKQFNIPSSTLSTILKNKDNILRKYKTNKGTIKRMKISEYPDIEMQGIGVKAPDQGVSPMSKDNGKNRRKSRWKLKFHHQALPPEYLNHYEASMMSPQPSPGISTSPAPVTIVGNVKSKLPPEAQTSVRFDDLPYMGEMTLDNAKPRRGRKPKKADICHLIYKNYGTTVVEEPLNLCVRDQPISTISDFQLPGCTGSALQEKLNLQSKDSKRKSKKSLARERLEKTFKEKGFLIQTQQLESAQGATYCKFRQLRKFTRYLFRSWKHHLPGDVVDNGVNSQIT